jgi:hypothetical protein
VRLERWPPVALYPSRPICAHATRCGGCPVG